MLSPVAQTILTTRILRKGETAVDMVERVAGAAFPAPGDVLKRTRLVDMMDPGKVRFLFNSPAMTHLGTSVAMNPFACFPAGTMVSTLQGPRPIETLEVGDLVLTHNGHYRPVTATMQREAQLWYLKVQKLPAMTATAEHPFLTDGGWVTLEDLVPGVHVIHVGRSHEVQPNPTLRAGAITSPIWNTPVGTLVETEVAVTTEVAWLLGMYIAQGSLHGHSGKDYEVRFTLGQHNRAQADRLADILRTTFDVTASIQEQEKAYVQHAWLSVRASSLVLAEVFRTEFGKGFGGKCVPSWLMHAPTHIQQAFLQGVSDGDGTRINKSQTRITLSNEVLVRQLFEIAVRCGETPSLARAHMPAGATAQPWSLTYGGRAKRYLVEHTYPTDEVTTVYNIEVADDHTYVANQMVVHNCFVLEPEDSLESIFGTLKDVALIHQAGGGTGFCFDNLRPEGSLVTSSQGEASGPVSFMELYNAGTEVVKQGGTRRGANMGTLSISHPDIMKFITLKRDLTRLTNFNVSVLVDGPFMEAVDQGGWVCHQFPVPDQTPVSYLADLEWDLDEDCGHPTCQRDHTPARLLWDAIIESAWLTGDPGLLFIDRANATNPNPHLYRLRSTNPCGEQWLGAGESCVLGSHNLAAFALPGGAIDWDLLAHDVALAVEALDNLIDVAYYPLPHIEAATKRARRIGLGVMGWADLLIAMGIRYDSDEALELAEDLGSFIHSAAHATSQRLAKEKGCYPGWDGSIWSEQYIEMRNSAVTTVAPTGTISILAGCSSGIEPVFAFVMTRNQAGHIMVDRHPAYESWLSEHGPDAHLPSYFITAPDVSVEWHIKHQAVWQQHFADNAVSKTVNLPNSATREDVARAYLLAYESGVCKGITIYRDGCREGQVLTSGNTAPVQQQADRCGEEGCSIEVVLGVN